MNPKTIKKTFFNSRKRLRPNSQLINIRHSNLVLRAKESGVLTKAQYEAFRRMITKHLKGDVRLWFPPLSCIPITRKTAGHRMGKGVGAFDKLIFPIKQGGVLIEITSIHGFSPTLVRIFSVAVKKLPIKIQFKYIKSKNTSLKKSK